MHDRSSGRIRRALVAVALVCGVVSVAAPAAAAAPVFVDFTVREMLPVGTPGVLIASNVPGCASATVATVDASRTDRGRTTTFRGTKVFDCGGGDTFSLTFRAIVRGCSPIDVGTWRVTDGAGSFSGVKGGGLLVGSYRNAGGPGTACVNDGIDDRYTGLIRLAP